MVSKFSLFIRPDIENDQKITIEAKEDGETNSYTILESTDAPVQDVNMFDENDDSKIYYTKDIDNIKNTNDVFDSINAPIVDANMFQEKDNGQIDYIIDNDNTKTDSIELVNDVNADDPGEKVIHIKENVYHPTSEHDYLTNLDVDEETSDEMHKPYYLPMKDYSNEYESNYDSFDKSDFINDNVGNEILDEVYSEATPDYLDNSIVVTDNNEPYVDPTKASEEETSDKQTNRNTLGSEPHRNVARGVDNNDIESDVSTESPNDIIEDNYTPPADNSEPVYENEEPQYKSELPNFRSEFFNSENIENVVFSIPAQFRAFLQEPPDWINKDYW